jgi:hypothetical protein
LLSHSTQTHINIQLPYKRTSDNQKRASPVQVKLSVDFRPGHHND